LSYDCSDRGYRVLGSRKVLFFDLGETLVTQNIEDNLVTQQALERISRELPVETASAELYRIYRKGYRRNQPIRSSHNVEIPISAWMRELLRYALRKEPTTNIVKEATEIVVECRALNAAEYPDAREALKVLQGNYRIGVISNVSSHEAALEILRRVKFDRYVDDLVTSALTGIRKPDPGIFLYALSRMKVAPTQAVHVGDHPRNDVEGANLVGIKTVLIDRVGSESSAGRDRPTIRLRNLATLPHLIAQILG
jgi:FMN hydrolase / 5-amino-6-(5-phospho-D-ribitylamino)uracil phosphatase